MQAVSLCYWLSSRESNGGLEVPDFKTIQKLARTSFDISVYNSPVSTDHFHMMVRDLSKRCELAEPTAFHHFMDELASNCCLLQHYTQNIDCIKHHLPNLWEKTVQLHGQINEAMCQYCGWNGPLVPDWFCGSDLPDCNQCQEIALERERMGKRQRGIGRLRPNVILYKEQNPKGDTIGEMAEQDLGLGPEIVFVVGTALKVPGARRLATELCYAAKAQGGLAVWINTDALPSGLRLSLDLALYGDCDEVTTLLSC